MPTASSANSKVSNNSLTMPRPTTSLVAETTYEVVDRLTARMIGPSVMAAQ